MLVLHLSAMSQSPSFVKKIPLLLWCFLVAVFGVRGQAAADSSWKGGAVPTPQQFLGYALGSRFTTHDKIVAYFQRVAMAASDRMLLQEYGRTYEGRPL